MSFSNYSKVDSIGVNTGFGAYSYNNEQILALLARSQASRMPVDLTNYTPVESSGSTVKKFASGAFVGTTLALAGDYLLFRGKHVKNICKFFSKGKPKVKPLEFNRLNNKIIKTPLSKEAMASIETVTKTFNNKTKITADMIDKMLKTKANPNAWSTEDLRKYYSKLQNLPDPSIFGGVPRQNYTRVS